MEKFFIAIGMVLTLTSQPALANDFAAQYDADDAEEGLRSAAFDSEDAEYAAVPNAGGENSSESEDGKPAEPPEHVSDQIETALDSLSEDRRDNAIQQEENASLRDEIRKLKAQCACTPAPKKSKKIVKKTAKKKFVKQKVAKKIKKADLKKTPLQKKRALKIKASSPKRMIASNATGLATELPKKRAP